MMGNWTKIFFLVSIHWWWWWWWGHRFLTFRADRYKEASFTQRRGASPRSPG